jgi:metal-responsive CopG/Arc/MetJ family transcriptional regulator
MVTKTKIIQVPMSRALADELDEVSRERELSRAALIRELCERFLKQLEDERLDREYVAAYERMPETEEEEAWAKLGEQMAAEVWEDEDWSDWFVDEQQRASG